MRTLMVLSMGALLAFFGLAPYAPCQETNSGRQTLGPYTVVMPAPNLQYGSRKAGRAHEHRPEDLHRYHPTGWGLC